MFKICHKFKKITGCLLWAGMLAGCKTPAPEPEPVSEVEQLRADVDFVAVMTGVTL